MGKVVFREQVHTFQIDINGHVNNAVYVEWLEVGRTRILEAVGRPVESMHERGYLPVLVETRIQYREPVFFPDTVRIEIWASELTHVTVWLEFKFFSEKTGRLVAQARQRGVFVDAKTNRPYRITQEDREAFDAVLLPSEVKL
jgi:acyl-CoA thioester hydrolase